ITCSLRQRTPSASRVRPAASRLPSQFVGASPRVLPSVPSLHTVALVTLWGWRPRCPLCTPKPLTRPLPSKEKSFLLRSGNAATGCSSPHVEPAQTYPLRPGLRSIISLNEQL